MDTPIYDQLVSQTSAPAATSPEAEPADACQWCGTPIDAGSGVEQAATDAAADAATDDIIPLLACSAEHMAALEVHRSA